MKDDPILTDSTRVSESYGMRTSFAFLGLLFLVSNPSTVDAESLLAGVGKENIARDQSLVTNNPPFVKALALTCGESHAIIITVDAVAIAEIGTIRDPYLENVRKRANDELGIPPESILINASHCHAVISPDIENLTMKAITAAWNHRIPVRAGVGTTTENEVQINRRLRLKSGQVRDVRHAYSLPPDEEVDTLGPIDPEIGLLRLDRIDTGIPHALLYNFAMHPIMGNPSGENSADVTGIASSVIEANLGEGDATAFFIQGCGGDINPVHYKFFETPRNAEPLGHRLGLRILKTSQNIETYPTEDLSVQQKILSLPRANLGPRIEEMEERVDELTNALRGTTLDFETFLPLYIKYNTPGAYPAASAHRYLQDELLEKEDWKTLDKNNRAAIEAYLQNIRLMEELTRTQINLALLRKHHRANQEAGPEIKAELNVLRIGDFHLVTFPAELTTEVGLQIKKASLQEHTFVAGYTNGYLYYAPSKSQLNNRGGAQEDSDCLLAPEWQEIFTEAALNLLPKQ